MLATGSSAVDTRVDNHQHSKEEKPTWTHSAMKDVLHASEIRRE
jgi:hypothetical protein